MNVRLQPQMTIRHAVVLWLLFLALFARGLLPSGTMLAFGADKVSVVLCTAQGAFVQALDKNGSALKSHHGDTCPFGFALSMAAEPTADMPLFLNSAVLMLAPELELTAASLHPREFYSARAPPLV